MHVGGEGRFPGFDLLGQRGLCHPVSHEVAVPDGLQPVVRRDVLDDIGEGRRRFERYARHGIQGGGVPEAVFREAEYHNGCRTSLIYNYFAGVWDQGLGPVDVQDVQSAGMEDLMDLLQLTGMFDITGRAAQLGQRRLGDVIPGRSESAGSDDDVMGLQFRGQGLDDGVVVVRQGNHAVGADTEGAERAGYFGGIGVNNLSDQDFISDRADRSLYHSGCLFR